MTTLPQTTALRIPRQSNGASMIPSPGSLLAAGVQHAPAGGAGGFQMTGADVWRVIRSNLWLIIGLFVLAGAIGFGLNFYLLNNFARYTARGYVRIQPESIVFDPLKPQTQDMNSQMLAIKQRTQAQLLTHESLFSRLLQKPESPIRDTDWFKQFIGKDGQPDIAAAKEALADDLSVRPIPDSELVEVAMSYSVPKDARTIVETLVNQHLEEQRTVNTDKQLNRSTMLNNLKRKYEFQLNDLTRNMREQVVRLNIDGMSGQPGRLNAKDLELQELMKQQFEIQRNAAEAKSAYDNLTAQIQNGIDPPSISEMVDRDPDVLFFRQQVNSLDLQLAQSAGLGKDHRDVQRYQKMRDAAQQKLDEARAQVIAATKASMVEELRAQVETTQADLKSLTDRIAAAKAELGDLTYQMATYLTQKDEETAIRELLKQYDEQLAAIGQAQQQADSSGVTWATRPETPDRPSFPRLPIVMGGCMALGLALALGIAFLREILDNSVRSPRDIARVGQLNMLGMIPDEGEDPQSTGSALPLVIAQAPHSMMAEQFRQVRTRLQQAATLDSTRSILVTSPSPGDGKTTVAGNLAIGLALNGRRILLVDANFRRPELHRLFNVAGDGGFSGVLASPETFASAVQQTQIPNLDVLPAGAKPANATELLESQLLIDFIERALEEYDHVIFDSGPLLFASETVAMAPRVDGVVSVIRARTSSRGLLQRMRDELRKLKADHLGVVLNGVRSQAGGYYNRNIKTYYAYQNGHAG